MWAGSTYAGWIRETIRASIHNTTALGASICISSSRLRSAVGFGGSNCTSCIPSSKVVLEFGREDIPQRQKARMLRQRYQVGCKNLQKPVAGAQKLSNIANGQQILENTTCQNEHFLSVRPSARKCARVRESAPVVRPRFSPRILQKL